MEWLNYHHLLYFWMVAKEGTITEAGEILNLAPSTISVQIKTLEEHLEEELFERKGRKLILTERGKIAFSYADEIFGLGQEMLDTLQSRPVGRPLRLSVGVADVLWKEIAHQLIEPALQMEREVNLICLEGTIDELLGRLVGHSVDVVLADNPIGPTSNVEGFNHLLGECGVAFFGDETMVKRYTRKFPESLDGAPMLLPTDRTALRRHLEQWFDQLEIRPRTVAEFDDSALMTEFGAKGRGVFPAPTVIEVELGRQHDVEIIGVPDEVKQSFYAISVDRKIEHPAVQAICEAARQAVFR